MRRVATAFTGEALFAGGLDISPRFPVGKPQVSVGLIRSCRRRGSAPQFSPGFETFSAAVLAEVVAEDRNKPANPLHRRTGTGLSVHPVAGAPRFAGECTPVFAAVREFPDGVFYNLAQKIPRTFQLITSNCRTLSIGAGIEDAFA
jgi:hypothetical protein